MEENWHNNQHPALIAAACQAVGGNPQETYAIGSAVVLLTGAADIHDDIIDKSKTKTSKQTAYGKFGPNATLLAGDALLFTGLIQFNKACQEYSVEKRNKLLGILEDAFLRIGNVAVNEDDLKRKQSPSPEQYRQVLEDKGAIAQACTIIGAIIGDGEPSEVEALANVGKTLGTLMTIRNEFADLQYPEEFISRAKGEVLPLPALYAFKHPAAKKQILDLLRSRLTTRKARQIAEVVLETEAVKDLKKEMALMAENAKTELARVKGDMEAFQLLLELATTDL